MTLSELIKTKTSLSTEEFYKAYLGQHYKTIKAFYAAVAKRTLRLDTVILIVNVLEVKFEDIEWSFKPKKNMLKLPARMNVSRATHKIEAGRPITKNELRAKAKKSPLYHLAIDNGGVNGTTDEGQEIPINCLGKWIFGVAGYKGHIIVMESSETGDIYLPNDAPQAVYELIQMSL